MVRQRAAQVLGEIPAAGALAVHSLIQALAGDEEIVRLEVLNALQNLGTAAAPAVPALIGVLTGNDDLLLRRMAADALGAIGPPAEEAAPQLLKCLQEPGNDALPTYYRLKFAGAAGASRESRPTSWRRGWNR